ncbi:MAG: thiamine phosphate synthase [Chlorobi bacterium]|nr:thiamine phosphate synthase [Chlorobiota bacterium]
MHRFKARIRGVYAIIDARYVDDERLPEFTEQILEGGVSIIQMRDKDVPMDRRLKRLKTVLGIAKKYEVPVIVNDIPELQQATGADGVHLGRDEEHLFFPLRKLNNEIIIGISAYQDLDRALRFALEGADYVAFGSVFPSPSEPNRRKVPLEVLRKAKEMLTIPIVGIGGITPENAEQIIDYVDAVAVMSALTEKPYETARQLTKLFEWK